MADSASVEVQNGSRKPGNGTVRQSFRQKTACRSEEGGRKRERGREGERKEGRKEEREKEGKRERGREGGRKKERKRKEGEGEGEAVL